MKVSGGKKRKLIDINITPFVDIMLVLLIIFMVTAPMVTNEIQVQLPSSAGKQAVEKLKYVNLSIDSSGQITIEKKQYDISALEAHLQTFKMQDHIHIYADKTTKYQDIVKVLEILARGGFSNTSFMVENG